MVASPGQRLFIKVDAAEIGSALDGTIKVLGANDAVLATADDTPIPSLNPVPNQNRPTMASPDPSVTVTVPAGQTEIALLLRDLESHGGIGYPYRITVTPIVPSFEIALNEGQASVPRNGSAAIGVTIKRKEYNGPITLNVLNPPAGLTVRPGSVAEGQTVGTFTVSAAADASFNAVVLDVVGQAQGPGGPIVVYASKSIVFSTQTGGPQGQQSSVATNTLTQQGLPLAPALVSPVRLETPAEPVEVAHGCGAAVPVKADRAAGAEGVLALSALSVPPGVTVAAGNLAEKANEASVTVTAAPEAALGTYTIALVAKGKVANVERALALPAVTLNVVRPAAIELAAPGVEVKAGQTVEVKGKVVRKGTFKEPVTVKLNALPAGLKADPVTVAPDQSDFTAKLIAEPNAPAATAGANVSIAFQINKKDYLTPPAPLAVKVVPASPAK